MKRERANYDSPWKEVLEAYFPQAMQFFFPETAALIDWQRPYEFLDKEFQQIAREGEIGKRYADKLVKVWRHQGEELWLLVHIEIQAKSEKDFAERMFTYSLRIFDRFHQPPISLAILCDPDEKWRPQSYSYSYPQTRLNFEFGIVKLLDYEKRWAELEASDNVFATVVMAHLKTQQTRKKPLERKTWKLSLIRRLYELGCQEQEIRNLYRFIDWVMILPRKLENEFWEEFKQFEQENCMSYITTGERIGYERGKLEGKEQGRHEGRHEGRQEGRQEGQQALILRQLQKRLGELSPQERSRVQSLSLPQLEALGEALLDLITIEDLRDWLQANQP